MFDVVKLTSMVSSISNKKVEPDEDGYYYVTLGAFNVRNSAEMIYSFDGIPEILANKSSILNRRLLAKRLRGESDHPVREPAMSDEQFVLRNLKIPMDRVSHHIKKIDVIETNKSENIPGTGNVVLIKGLVIPSGELSSGLKQSLDNPNEDTCFSIRCFANDVRRGLNIVKYMRQIVTWDWIGEPGVRYASKLGNPVTESIDYATIDIDSLVGMLDSIGNNPVSVESSDNRDSILELINSVSSDPLSKW